MTGYFRDLFAYDRWANGVMMGYLREHAGEPDQERLRGIFAHLIANMTPWVYLLRGEAAPEGMDLDPVWSVEECAAQLALRETELETILEGLVEADLERFVRSPGPAGRVWEDTVAEVLTNILLHGQHHRGQMEMVIEEQTGSYRNTFYMAYIRKRGRAGFSS